MADISASAAKEHILKGAESTGVTRVSGDGVKTARELGQAYMAELGKKAGEEAQRAGRKTIMPQDLHAAVRSQHKSSADSSGDLSSGQDFPV